MLNIKRITESIKAQLGAQSITKDEFGYLSGLTGNIQEQFGIPTNFTPTFTLVGGTGNTVPSYSTVQGRYCVIGSIAYVDFLLSNTSGGTAGAGSGAINIKLPPVLPSSHHPEDLFPVGRGRNGNNEYMLFGRILASATTLELFYWSSVSATAIMTGSLQGHSNNRVLRGKYFYEVGSN